MQLSRHSDDTVDLPKLETEHEPGAKRCCQCGKDLRGHRRFKDSVGYWCKDCHRVDKARHTVAEARCPDCGRMRPLDKLYQTDEGTQVCKSCMNERVAQAKRRAVKLAIEQGEKSGERMKTLALVGVLVLLALVVLWQNRGFFFGE
ncbi:MAG: hypothetical protein ACK4PI_00860 [Tepidisphaerales bacterium]